MCYEDIANPAIASYRNVSLTGRRCPFSCPCSCPLMTEHCVLCRFFFSLSMPSLNNATDDGNDVDQSKEIIRKCPSLNEFNTVNNSIVNVHQEVPI